MTNGEKLILKSFLITLIKSNSAIKRRKQKMKIKSLVLLLSFCACTNIEYKGKIVGNERGAINEVEIASDLTETIKLKSKVKTPYSYSWTGRGIPDYAETGLEINF